MLKLKLKKRCMKNLVPLPYHPRKFTPLPHVEPREVFERVSNPLNPDAKPWRLDYRVADQRSSGLQGARGQQREDVGSH